MPIKNIVFDLGRVLLNIAPENTIDRFKELGFNEVEKKHTFLKQSGVFEKLEKGQISPSAFAGEIRNLLAQKCSDQQIVEAWKAMILEIPEKNIRLLRKLKPAYRLFLLSNTNQIHIEKVNSDLQSEYGIDTLDELFEKAYYSHDLAMSKPDPEIYRKVLALANLKPAETLFIDDRQENTRAAQKLGIQSHLLLPDEVLEQVLRQHGIVF